MFKLFNTDCDLDRVAKTLSKFSTFEIQISGSVDKCKHCIDKSLLSSESEANDTPLKKKKSKSSASTPMKQNMLMKGAENDSNDTLLNIVTKRVKKQ